MKIESSFSVAAPPDAVFAFLLDPEQVVRTVPGAELVELVDAQTFRGKLKVKVGAVQVAYAGTAHVLDIVEDETSATVSVDADAREIGGQGSVKAKLSVTVAVADAGSDVALATDFTVTGRIAQFGRGVIEDVGKRLIGQMAESMRARLTLVDQPQ